MALAGGIHISLNQRRDMCRSPVFSSLANKKEQLRLRQESNNLKGRILLRSQGDTHITEPAQRYVYTLIFLLLLKEISSISSKTTINTTRLKIEIRRLERRNIMPLAVGIHEGPNRVVAFTVIGYNFGSFTAID